MNNPLVMVFDAFSGGARTVSEIVARTGLNPDVVSGAIDHLIFRGQLTAEPLASGCPEGACGGCALLKHGCGGSPTRQPPTGRGRSLFLATAGQWNLAGR